MRGITAIKGTGEDLPFRNGVFDFTLIVTTICFFDDPLKALREAYRVTKKNGYTVVGFVDRNSPLGETYIRKRHDNVFYRDAHFYSSDEVLNGLFQAGFGDFESVQTVFGDISKISSEQDFRKGYGEGDFVVIRGFKRSD